MTTKPELCMACDVEIELDAGLVIDNGDMEPWTVCMRCYRAHERGDDDEREES